MVILFYFSVSVVVFDFQGSPAAKQHVVPVVFFIFDSSWYIVNYLFYRDDSLTSKGFTMRTEQLIKCFEPLQKLRVRLGPLNRFKPQVTLYY